MNEIKQKLLAEAHSIFFKLMLEDYPLESLKNYVVDDVMGFGTALEEKVFGIDSLNKLAKLQRQQGEGLNIQHEIKPVSRRISGEEDIAILVDEGLIKMPVEGGVHELHIRVSTIFEFKNEVWKVIHWHASTPIATEGDTWHIDEWKRKNDELQKLVNEKTAALNTSLEDLKSAQAQLIHAEKMAALGELTAGIAHEIQNPLNFVNNFSEVNKELAEELTKEITNGNFEEAKIIANDIKENEIKIYHHGKRADTIVKGMLLHSRSSNGVKESTDINALVDEYLRLAYHGLRAKDKSFNAKLETAFDESIGNINVIPQDIGRVILNLITNAFYEVAEKKKENIAGYEPTVSVRTKTIGNSVFIYVTDNGNGIPQKVLDKMFQPFFTTKPTGQGTGLGLSLSYDIVKAHGGELKVETSAGQGATFIIQLKNM